MKHKVYIVIKDCSYDYDADLEVDPYGDLNEAVDRFNSIAEELRLSAQDDDWVIEKDTPHCFSAYKDGYEAQNHSYVRLQISEINIK